MADGNPHDYHDIHTFLHIWSFPLLQNFLYSASGFFVTHFLERKLSESIIQLHLLNRTRFGLKGIGFEVIVVISTRIS